MNEPNTFKVSKKQWKFWRDNQRRVFNYVYELMIDNDEFFTHPKAPRVSKEHWKTTAWNAAWTAADAAGS